MATSKLVRNLKRGDKITISDGTHKKTIEVFAVQEVRRGFFTRKRTWEVKADYPWWWGCTGILGYHDTRLELATA